MKLIKLTQDKETLVDDQDFLWLNQYKWQYSQGYASTNHKKMQNLIMNPPRGLYVDHIDGNPLNNQRSNLRLATNQENTTSKKKTTKPKQSKYKGVCQNRERWLACLHQNGKKINIGTYSTEEEAAIAYDLKAIEIFKEFAKTNIIPNPYLTKETIEYKTPVKLSARRKRNFGKSSKFNGVHWCKRENAWIATIRISKKNKYIGKFLNEVAAAEAYNKIATANQITPLNIIPAS